MKFERLHKIIYLWTLNFTIPGGMAYLGRGIIFLKKVKEYIIHVMRLTILTIEPKDTKENKNNLFQEHHVNFPYLMN